MSDRKLEIQVGIVFVLAVVVLVLGILWFKNARLRADNQELTIAFPKTSGLVRGDAVEVRGVPSGNVREIRYEDGRALVRIDLDEGVEIQEDTRFVIENVGIMGQKMIAVYPGQGPKIDAEDRVLEGIYQSGVTELLSDLGGTLEAFDRMAQRLDQAMASFDSQGGSLGRTLQNTEQITEDLAQLLQESRQDIASSIRSLSAAMDDIHQALDGREDDIGRIVQRTERASARLDTSLVTFGTAVHRLNDLLGRVERGEGTLGRIVQDEALHDELVTTLRETRTLVADIRAHPKKYVKLSLF